MRAVLGVASIVLCGLSAPAQAAVFTGSLAQGEQLLFGDPGTIGQSPGIYGGDRIVFDLTWSGGSISQGDAFVLIWFNWKRVGSGGTLENDAFATSGCSLVTGACSLFAGHPIPVASATIGTDTARFEYLMEPDFDVCTSVPSQGDCARTGHLGLAYLDVTFDAPTDYRLEVSLDRPAIPEPATWAMLIAGFGLVGTVARRRYGNSLGRT